MSRRRTAMAEHDEVAQGRLRRLNLILQIPPIALAGVLLVVLTSDTWWTTLVLSLGVVVALLAMERWTAGDLGRFVLPALIVTAAVWLFGVLVADNDGAFFGLTVVISLAVPQLGRHRVAAGLALVGFVAASGATRLLVAQDDVAGDLLSYVVIPVAICLLATGLMFGHQVYLDLMQETRERESELAVAQERIRFASDLHDIQGHTLHVVKLKTVLAQKLVRADAARAEQELSEIHALVADTIAQTKNLAHAQRRLNLSAEIENAKNLFEAAGIHVRVMRSAEADARTSELLGQVLRETTTNILRHAQARQVWITLTGTGIDIVNDGARDGDLPELSGLSGLRQRVADDGGGLTVEQAGGRFRTAATFPRTRSGTTPALATASTTASTTKMEGGR